jgi:hypothetical protein
VGNRYGRTFLSEFPGGLKAVPVRQMIDPENEK